MNRDEALEIARELKECSEEYESITVLEHDTEFFDYVIKELERTAQEVPVQEQSTIYVNLDEDFTKEIVATISKLNKLLNQECITTTYQNF